MVGEADARTVEGMTALPSLRKVLARLRFGKRRRTDLIVIHTGETGETAHAAEGMGSWFQNAQAKGSAHVGFDVDSEVQYAEWDDICAGARGGDVNKRAVHAEHAGRAGQSAAEWADPYSTAVLRRSAFIMGVVAFVYGLPVVRLTPAQVRAGAKGFCGHNDVTDAYGIRGGHWDPGPNFPWGRYLGMVQEVVSKLQGSPSTPATAVADLKAIGAALDRSAAYIAKHPLDKGAGWSGRPAAEREAVFWAQTLLAQKRGMTPAQTKEFADGRYGDLTKWTMGLFQGDTVRFLGLEDAKAFQPRGRCGSDTFYFLRA